MTIPFVSIIIPCYNEEATISLLLEAILKQTYPRTALEVIIADGLSTDQTRAKISAFQQAHADLPVLIVDNLKKTIPAALNTAIGAAKGEIMVRLDAHSVPYPDYVARCVEAISEGMGDNVGGVWEIQPGDSGWQARVIAAAVAHPLGVGDALYRYTTVASLVDTVPFGAFRKELIQMIGPFDETLLANEDYEFNVRVRQHGGRVWLNPAIRSIYFARAKFSALAKQYWRYGYWKYRMLRRYPQTLRWRQGLPPLFVLSLLFLGLIGIWLSPLWWVLLAELAVYVLAVSTAAVHIAYTRKDFSIPFGVPLAIATMHLMWGSGFLWSLFTYSSTKKC